MEILILRKGFSDLWIYSCFRRIDDIVLDFRLSPKIDLKLYILKTCVLKLMIELRAWFMKNPSLVMIFIYLLYTMKSFEWILKNMLWNVLNNIIFGLWFWFQKREGCLYWWILNVNNIHGLLKITWPPLVYWKNGIFHSFDLCFWSMNSLC